MWRLMIRPTAWAESRLGERLPWRSMGRNTAPLVIWVAFDPVAVGPHRTGERVGAVDDLDPSPGLFLVGLGPAQPDQESFGVFLDVGSVESDELGATEPTGLAQPQDRPVPVVDEPVTQIGERGAEVCGGEAALLGGGDAEGAADASHGLGRQRVPARVERSGDLVALADGGQAPLYGRDPPGRAVIGRFGQARPHRPPPSRGWPATGPGRPGRIRWSSRPGRPAGWRGPGTGRWPGDLGLQLG